MEILKEQYEKEIVPEPASKLSFNQSPEKRTIYFSPLITFKPALTGPLLT